LDSRKIKTSATVDGINQSLTQSESNTTNAMEKSTKFQDMKTLQYTTKSEGK
jgi:hypothetical protein